MPDPDDKKGVVLFGRDVVQIPCFRTSFLTGIGGGIVVGLGYFMLTSRTRRAAHVGFGGYLVLTSASWIYCRYNYAKNKTVEEKVLKRAIQEHILMEGTSKDSSVKKS